jgi:hypothetical protein
METTMAGPSREPPAAALDALTKGHKIEAIKIVRQQWGIGLKEAKDAVDGYVAARPDLTAQIRQARVPASSGMKRTVLWLFVLAGASVLLYAFSHR